MKTTNEEDMILIQNILNGNQVAQKTLYEKCKKNVELFIKKKYPKSNDIDDDVSEIVIKVFFNLKNYDPSKSKFNSWVLSIANNYMIDKWRSYSCQSNVNYTNSVTLEEYHTTMSSYNCDYAYENTSNTMFCNDFENSNYISHISKQISEEDFNMLTLKYVQGYNYSEIGEIYNLTSTTVSNKVNYIKTKLKKNNNDDIFE